MIKTILFDIDNTLYDFDRGNEEGLRTVSDYCAKHFGWSAEQTLMRHKQARRAVEAVTGKNCAAAHNRLIRFQFMLENENLPLEPHALTLYHCYWDTLLSCIVPDEELTSFLRWAKEKDLRIGIATNMTAYVQYLKLRKLSILPYVDFIVTSEEAGAEKPDPAFFARCLAKAQCPPEQCLMVGDSLRNDVLGARDAGMQGLWFTAYSGKTETDDAQSSVHSVQNFNACREWIEEQL